MFQLLLWEIWTPIVILTDLSLVCDVIKMGYMATVLMKVALLNDMESNLLLYIFMLCCIAFALPQVVAWELSELVFMILYNSGT